jgi:hypothetical protein
VDISSGGWSVARSRGFQTRCVFGGKEISRSSSFGSIPVWRIWELGLGIFPHDI